MRVITLAIFEKSQKKRVYSFLIRSVIWSGQALLLVTKGTSSDNFCVSFKTLSFSQPVYSLFAADEETNPEMAGHAAIGIYNI